MIKNFSDKSVDNLEQQLDDFVAELEPGQLISVSPITMNESSNYSLYCEYGPKRLVYE